jgi:hypothetical protein
MTHSGDLLASYHAAHDEGISFGEALNRAISRGLTPAPVAVRVPYRLPTFNFGGQWDAKTIKEFLHEEEMERYLKTTRRGDSE